MQKLELLVNYYCYSQCLKEFHYILYVFVEVTRLFSHTQWAVVVLALKKDDISDCTQ